MKTTYRFLTCFVFLAADAKIAHAAHPVSTNNIQQITMQTDSQAIVRYIAILRENGVKKVYGDAEPKPNTNVAPFTPLKPGTDIVKLIDDPAYYLRAPLKTKRLVFRGALYIMG